MDWTCATHKLGVGLPVRTKNEPGWFYKAPLLANKSIRPSPAQMKACNAAFCQLLRIRCAHREWTKLGLAASLAIKLMIAS